MLRQTVVQARWVQGKEWYNLVGFKGACCYPIGVGAIGMLDKFTAYSDETLEEMNSVSLIGGELSFFHYR